MADQLLLINEWLVSLLYTPMAFIGDANIQTGCPKVFCVTVKETKSLWGCFSLGSDPPPYMVV